jgi:exodeoxyribonuclease V alpha subunit
MSYSGSRSRALLLELDLLPDPPPLGEAVLAAAEEGALTIVDLQTVRDLLQLAALAETGETADLRLLLMTLLMALNAGHACLRIDAEADPASAFVRHARLADVPAQWIAAAWPRIRSALDERRWPGLITEAHAKPPVKAVGTEPDPPNLRLSAGIETGGTTSVSSAGGFASASTHTATGSAPTRPVVLRRHGTQIFLYFQRYYRHEEGLRDRLRALSAPHPPLLPGEQAQTIARSAARYRQFTLSPEQILAMVTALQQRLTLITGGPGSGKTTVICSILRALLATGIAPQSIALVAPTGRAAQRMGEALRTRLAESVDLPESQANALTALSGMTIHQLLRYQPARNRFRYDAANPLPLDVLIADEVSMIDLVLMHQLLQAVPDTCRVVFLGDRHQLPSVEAGAVLGELVPRDHHPAFSNALAATMAPLAPDLVLPLATVPSPLTDRVILLPRSHRNRGGLASVADAINRGQADEALAGMPTVAMVPGGAIDWLSFESSCARLTGLRADDLEAIQQAILAWLNAFRDALPTPNAAYIQRVLASWPDALFETQASPDVPSPLSERLRPLFDTLNAARVLTVVRRGPFGAAAINRVAAADWRPRLDPAAAVGAEIFAGAPIMITRNDPVHGLFNGDCGIVLRSASGLRFACFPQGMRTVVCRIEQLPEHAPAFAMTIHKSQGSEYGRVMVVLPPDPDHPLLVRELLYTAITRARHSAFICGSKAAIQAAIARRMERQAGPPLWPAADAFPERH